MDKCTHVYFININTASLKQCRSRPGDGFMQDGGGPLYDRPSIDIDTYPTATNGAEAENCPGPPMAYKTPLTLNREKNQEFREYSTLKQ